MTLEPDHGFKLLSLEEEEKLERILNERSQGAYGLSALHGVITASVVGPKPVPLDWIVQTVLSGPDSEENGFDHFPEFSWAAEKIEELFLGISRGLQQDPEVFCLVVDRTKLEGDETTPDPRTWCLGFVKGMTYHEHYWEAHLQMDYPAVGLITMIADEGGWGEKDGLNLYKKIPPSELCEALQIAILAIHRFWPAYNDEYYRPIPAPVPIRSPVVPGRNQPCPCGSGRKFKRCCGGTS